MADDTPAAKARDKTAALRKRFYKSVGVEPGDDGFLIKLDGHPVKTPGKADVLLSARALADAIAEEWDAQVEKINPHSMPLTQIACTAIDKVAPNRTEIRDQMVRFANADLLCYRAETPMDLAQRQHNTWQPVLDWLADAHGIALATSTALIAEDQDPGSLRAAMVAVGALDDHELAAMAVLTQALGSFALAMAVVHGHLDWEAATGASQLDEKFQSELWGEDREAVQRLRVLRDDIAAAARYLTLHRTKN
ncbi:ATP12 family protein [Thalassospiraceae bacterium LMO-JJ14]|nr:ATP12 family protein [Thalassospiraceae bacterium LMO-JJ14]